MLTRVYVLAVVVTAVMVSGCESRPRAPLLRNGPVYENSAEGIKFLVPEGWQQNAAAELPTGDLPDELFLVRYALQTPDGGAMLQVLVLQEKTPIDLGKHHAGPSFRVEKWTPVEGRKDLEFNGTPVEHYEYKAKMAGRDMTKEIYAVRRGDRAYSFAGLYHSTDDYARQQIARAMGSLQVK